jgi:hypothetical protein
MMGSADIMRLAALCSFAGGNRMTCFTGFQVNSGEYKVMAWLHKGQGKNKGSTLARAPRPLRLRLPGRQALIGDVAASRHACFDHWTHIASRAWEQAAKLLPLFFSRP